MKLITEKILINIDAELTIIEGYYNRAAVDLSTAGSLRFVPTMRFPVNTRTILDKKINQKLIRNSPSMPWMCVPDVKRCVLHNIYQSKNDIVYDDKIFDAFKRNRLIPNGGKGFITDNGWSKCNDDWLDHEYFFKDEVLLYMTDREKYLLHKCMDSIIEMILYYTNQYPNNVFDLDVETIHIFIENMGEIGTYRYFEFLEWKECN